MSIPCHSFESPEACDKALAFIHARLAEAKAPANFSEALPLRAAEFVTARRLDRPSADASSLAFDAILGRVRRLEINLETLQF